MDPRLLRHYNQELKFLREQGAEFAQEFPKIAGRLGLEGLECADPYVERLLEGCAFLTARVQLKLEAEFPRFTQHLLELVYPHYLAPVPSMAVVQLKPDFSQTALKQGCMVPRGTALKSLLGAGETTPCEYRTAHALRLWPIELRSAQYLPNASAVADFGIADLGGVKAALRLRLGTAGKIPFAELPLDRLALFLTGDARFALYEQLAAHALGVDLRPPARPAQWQARLPATAVRATGFSADEEMLPNPPQAFSGYRLLQEYFCFPERYLFIELGGLQPALAGRAEDEIDFYILLDRADPKLEQSVDAASLALHCTPAVNLFPRRFDRIHLNDLTEVFHVVPDRTRPQDFEVWRLTEVTGHGTAGEAEQRFAPLYDVSDWQDIEPDGAYYTVQREPRRLSERQRRQGARSSYLGSELYIALTDLHEAPYRGNLKQLALAGLCTNRDLPLHLSFGKRETDFTLDTAAPVSAVRCLAGPTPPRPARAEGDPTWALINHLSLNYLSLIEGGGEGAAGLRSLLSLYADWTDAAQRKQIDGVRAVASRPLVRRLPGPGPIAVGRGLEIALTLHEPSFEGTGAYLLGAVLEEFLARYATLNSFTETVLCGSERGEIKRWPARLGRRPIL